MKLPVTIAFTLLTLPALAGETPTAFNTKNAAAAVSGAAAVNPIQAINSAFGKVQAFTLSDLQNAAADAAAQTPPDTRHGQCWSALATVVQNQNPSGLLPSQLGAATAIQKVFDLQSTYEGHQAWKDQLATACALTVVDLATDLNTLLAKAGISLAGTAITLPKL